MTDDMIERVAMALCKADDGGNVAAIFASKEHHGDCTHEAFTCALCEADHYRNLARTAIEAMREPTRGMSWALLDELKRQNDSGHSGTNTKAPCVCKMNVPDLYRAMINTALKECDK